MVRINAHWDPKQNPDHAHRRNGRLLPDVSKKNTAAWALLFEQRLLADADRAGNGAAVLAQGEEIAALVLINPLPPRTWMKTPTAADRYRSRVAKAFAQLGQSKCHRAARLRVGACAATG